MSALKRPGIWDKKAAPVIQGEQPQTSPTNEETKDSKIIETLEPRNLEIKDSITIETEGPVNLETLAPKNVESKESREIENNKSSFLENKESNSSESVKTAGLEGLNIETSDPIKRGTKGSSNKGTKESKVKGNKDSKNIGINNSRNLENKGPIILETSKPKRMRNISKQAPNSKGLINQGYMMDEELIAVLAFYTVLQTGEDRDKSTVMRKALRSYIPEKYFKRYREQMEEDSSE